MVTETAPLRAVAAMMEAGEYQAVIVITEEKEMLGVLLRDAVMRLSPRLPEAPVRMLPLQKAATVAPGMPIELAESMIEDGEFEAVVLDRQSDQSWSVLLRA
ncbi:MAG: hypothetical protein QM817_19320 [Archangium sp.]